MIINGENGQERANAILGKIGSAFHTTIIGQDHLLRELLTALIGGGHVLIEGVPGLAKTLAAKTIAHCIQADFKRIQFTPDLLPADITGTLIYREHTGDFKFRQGPIFSNIVLADEINRSPGKVQSALLEAMEERQVTLGDTTYPLPSPFFVIATQNPIEHEGTYQLPEAQIDRFFLKILLGYPKKQEEIEIIRRFGDDAADLTGPVISADDLHFIQEYCSTMLVKEELQDYIVELVRATRPCDPGTGETFADKYISFGASPRGSLVLQRCGKIFAFLAGRDYVLPEDIKAAVLPVLRHRIILSYEAESEGLTSDHILYRILQAVPVP